MSQIVGVGPRTVSSLLRTETSGGKVLFSFCPLEIPQNSRSLQQRRVMPISSKPFSVSRKCLMQWRIEGGVIELLCDENKQIFAEVVRKNERQRIYRYCIDGLPKKACALAQLKTYVRGTYVKLVKNNRDEYRLAIFHKILGGAFTEMRAEYGAEATEYETCIEELEKGIQELQNPLVVADVCRLIDQIILEGPSAEGKFYHDISRDLPRTICRSFRFLSLAFSALVRAMPQEEKEKAVEILRSQLTKIKKSREENKSMELWNELRMLFSVPCVKKLEGALIQGFLRNINTSHKGRLEDDFSRLDQSIRDEIWEAVKNKESGEKNNKPPDFTTFLHRVIKMKPEIETGFLADWARNAKFFVGKHLAFTTLSDLGERVYRGKIEKAEKIWREIRIFSSFGVLTVVALDTNTESYKLSLERKVKYHLGAAIIAGLLSDGQTFHLKTKGGKTFLPAGEYLLSITDGETKIRITHSESKASYRIAFSENRQTVTISEYRRINIGKNVRSSYQAFNRSYFVEIVLNEPPVVVSKAELDRAVKISESREGANKEILRMIKEVDEKKSALREYLAGDQKKELFFSLLNNLIENQLEKIDEEVFKGGRRPCFFT